MTNAGMAARHWHRRGLIVDDPVAESTVAACAVACHDEAERLVAELGPSDFYDRRYWSVIEAAASLDPDACVDGEPEAAEAMAFGDFGAFLEGCIRRNRAVSSRTGLEEAALKSLVANRPVLRDSAGYYTRRVREAAAARAETLAWLAEADRLDIDVSTLTDPIGGDEIAAMVTDIASHLAGILVGSAVAEHVDVIADDLAVILEALGLSEEDANATVSAEMLRSS